MKRAVITLTSFLAASAGPSAWADDRVSTIDPEMLSQSCTIASPEIPDNTNSLLPGGKGQFGKAAGCSNPAILPSALTIIDAPVTEETTRRKGMQRTTP